MARGGASAQATRRGRIPCKNRRPSTKAGQGQRSYRRFSAGREQRRCGSPRGQGGGGSPEPRDRRVQAELSSRRWVDFTNIIKIIEVSSNKLL